MSDSWVRVTLHGEMTRFLLRMAAGSISQSDPHMAAVVTAAADAWEAGDRGPLVTAVVALVDDLVSQLPPTMQTFAAGGEAASRLAAEAERQELAVQAIGGSVDEYRRLLGEGLEPKQAYSRLLHELVHDGGPGRRGHTVRPCDGGPTCPAHGGGQ